MKITDYVNSRMGEDAGFTVHERDGKYMLNTWGNRMDKETEHATRREAQILGMQWLLFCISK